ncbi:MAG: indolepyruvate ferredoxin oxidoreductase family protein [Hyphomicrobiaceae bacterium]|nr:indolepyruvate ferredoxin oxidoreductase family protein [Hyphomicrobiaceae bacterium]
MPKRAVSLSDKFDLIESRQILTGTQAVVRLALMQRVRDERAGMNTAGYVTGYRGSPIAGLEGAFERARTIVEKHCIRFQPGLNEDLAATALWGSQQAELRGEGKYDGVFGIWYGKGPGVDRTGDVFRHANHAGTSKHGGVLALLGDDHTCESSTSAHQSEFAMVDFMIPVLNPAGVQEILDYGLIGFALSRFAGVWVALKCVKDNIESTATVDGHIDRVVVKIPGEDEFRMPAGGLNIRLGDQPLAKEARLHDYKRAAMLAFARANKLDRLVMSGGGRPKLGIVTTGKSYLDVRQALDELGIDEVKANELGIRLYKVGMVWPLEPHGIASFADGLDTIMVVEEKRSLIETQVKEQLFDTPNRPRVIGKKDESEQWLFPAKGALEPTDIAIAVGERLIRQNAGGEALKAKVAELKQLKGNRPAQPEAFLRTPYFCAGCPHNSSTVVPEGMRAYAGIGCHYMAQWMERSTEGFTQMGGEGANWIGEAPFSKRGHVFQNLGDGTYIHSGSLAIRAALAAGTNITFKVLYNDAVAMTGGQKLDGHIGVPQIASQLLAEGVRRVEVVTDEPGKYKGAKRLPAGIPVSHRRDLMAVQRSLAEGEGVTALIYDQTCAAEKRRRRKRGEFPDPDKRVFINPAVCEGCGDCGRTSNCVAVVPLETELGRKRAIDQSACNKDFSCVEGFCPSFVTLHGAKVRKSKGSGANNGLDSLAASVPEPTPPRLDGPYSMLVTGVGGTGVVTISAVLGQAAHIEGKGFGSIDMTGLAQKGGAVACHMRVARSADEIHAIRVGVANADLVMGGDLVVTASNKILETIRPGETAVVVSTHEMTTGDFTRNPGLVVPGAKLLQAIADRVRKGPLHTFDAHDYAVKLFGDSIASNMFLLGYAYQLGHVPVGAAAIEQAIALNGAAVEMNRSAFRLGRLAAHDRHSIDRIARPVELHAREPQTLDDIIAFRARHLAAYQDEQLAARYRSKVAWIAGMEKEKAPGRSGLAAAVARAYHKLLSYKDEYEVARLFTDGTFQQQVAEQFDGVRAMEFHLAPPLLARFHKDKVTGHPRKIRLGGWMLPVFRLLAKGRALRGTRWDVFGYSAERKLERQMIADYERLLDEIAARLDQANHSTAVVLAELPLEVKGFGHVKLANYRTAKRRQADLLQSLTDPTTVSVAAE